MSREKMLEAEISLKNEQLADLNAEVEKLRRRADESEKFASVAQASREEIAKLKEAVGKLVPAAKKTVQCAAELQETRKHLAAIEAERNALAENCLINDGQTAALKNALAEAQSDILIFDAKRKSAARRARLAEVISKKAHRQKSLAITLAALVCTVTIAGSYVYVAVALKPPAELSEEAAAAFQKHAPEYRQIVEIAVESERENLKAERETVAAERNRFQELNHEKPWDKIKYYIWLALIFVGGFLAGAVTIIAAFVFFMR